MYTILFLTCLIVAATILSGFYYMYKDSPVTKKIIKRAVKFNLAAYVPVLFAAFVIMLPKVISAAAETAKGGVNGLGLLAAALATGFATIGAGYAVGSVGSAALGAVSEDSKILGKTLIFVGLAEGIPIYGLIISIMILGRL